jgi:hypothetical protein
MILDQHGQVQNHSRPVAIDRLDAGYRQILAPTANEAVSMPCDRGYLPAVPGAFLMPLRSR